jgi:hypothetical protein
MSTFNGIGNKFYGWHHVTSRDRTAYATEWFVFLFVPIVPLARYKLRILTDRANEGFFGGGADHYELLQRTELDWSEVVMTWWAFVRGLAIVLVPFFISLRISDYQNELRETGQPHNAVLGTVAAACLLFSLAAAIVVPMRALRRSRG